MKYLSFSKHKNAPLYNIMKLNVYHGMGGTVLILYFIHLGFSAIKLFVRDQKLTISNSRGQIVPPIPITNTDKSKAMVYDGNYQNKGITVYALDLNQLIPGLTRDNPCAVFDSETDYPTKEILSFGADALGNHAGQRFFGRNVYTFWLDFNAPNYVLPHVAGTYDWELYILCAKA